MEQEEKRLLRDDDDDEKRGEAFCWEDREDRGLSGGTNESKKGEGYRG